MKAFKFTNSRWAADLVSGKFRISPAHVMREADGFDDGRADEKELSSEARPTGGMEVFSDDHPAFDGMFTVVRGGKRVISNWVSHGQHVTLFDNALIYCVSISCEEVIRGQMLDKFNCDSLIEISDVYDLGRLLSSHPALSGRELIQGLVKYEDAAIGSIAEMPPVDPLKKRERFSWQREYRYIWRGEALPEAIVIDVPAAKNLLTKCY